MTPSFRHKFSVLSLTLFSGLVQAHSGYDHLHWSSGAVHILLFLAIITVSAVGLSAIVRANQELRRDLNGEKK